MIATMLLPMLAGCTGLGGPPEPNARVEADRSNINAGESVNFDARASTSPESTIITGYRWDFGDGSKAETVQGYTSHTFAEAGLYEIAVTVVNDLDGDDTATTLLTVNGFPKISFQVIWEEKTITYDWDGYLEQDHIHTITHIPSEEGRIMSFNATLTLAMDLLPIMLPQDNFSLTVDVQDDGWTHTVRTEQSNITHNASASMEYLNLNPSSEDAHNLTADSLEELIAMLDTQSGAGFGLGDWLWIIEAEEADPDFPIDEVDPDGGNEWELVVEFTFLVPRISEVGV